MLTPRVAALLLVSLSLTGCTLETTANPAASPAAAITGTAFGGQQPIASAKVYFLAVNTTGYGGRGITAASTNASLSLLNTGDGSDTIGKYVLTASSNGAFNLVGKYSCATGYNQSTGTSVSLPGNEQVYVYVLGGDAGAGANASSGLLAAVGPCNAPVATTLAVNEITTVAAAYALAGFATDATHISRSATALAATGVANAMLTAGNLVTVSTGLPTATTGTATRPVASLYSIADILAACVNTANGSPCTTLFAHTESAGDSGTAATDTATAAINLAHTPWPSDDGMNALFGLIPGTSPPYNGGLSAQPNDFTLGIQFSGGTLNEPTGIAIDAAGNVWLANQAAPTVTELSNLGVNVAGSPFSSHILGLNDAIDTLGNVWISGYNGSYIAKLSSAGASASGSPFTVGAQYASVTIDATNHVWSADEVSNLYVLNTSGTVTSTFTAGSLNGPQYVAFDSGGNAWVTNNLNNTVTELTGAGTNVTGSPTSAGSMDSPLGIGIDATNTVWVANSRNNSITRLVSSGSSISGTNITTGGLNRPNAIAPDGGNLIWVANLNSSVSEFTQSGAALSPSSGFIRGVAINAVYSLAIDGSGNIWIPYSHGNTVTEIIGSGTPTVTPAAAALSSPYNAAVARP